MWIPLAVLIAGCVLFVCRWMWQAMKRSDNPAAQEAVETFTTQVDELNKALRRLWETIIRQK